MESNSDLRSIKQALVPAKALELICSCVVHHIIRHKS